MLDMVVSAGVQIEKDKDPYQHEDCKCVDQYANDGYGYPDLLYRTDKTAASSATGSGHSLRE